MKKFKLILIAIFPLLLLNLTGCYTQVAAKGDYGNWNRSETKPYYDYESDDDTLVETYENEEYAYDDSDAYYEDGASQVEYQFYGYPSYRKYFWNYYPAVSVSLGLGSYYDPWYWNPWYSNYWYYPSVYCYYPTYWYPNYYYGYWDPYPYYGGYASSNYKHRTNDGYKVRNNSGTRNGGGRNSGRDRDVNYF